MCCFYFFIPISYFPGHQVLSEPHSFQGHKSENGVENKEVNGVAEKEEEEEAEEDDDEEDESSDPDIEEEIQASTRQDGPG